MDTFRPFSLMHGIVLIAFALLCVACIVLARHARARRRVLVERTVSILCIPLFVAVNHEMWFDPERFTLARSLPLHVCDLTLIVVPLALGLNWRPARVVLYYFGLLLSSQGLITPDLHEGPTNLRFWGFWLLHVAVVGGAVYDLGARGFRPRWRDLRLAIILGAVYVASMVALDLMLDANYGYVGPKTPQNPSVIDMLGPYPLRVFVMSALTIIVMTVATLPWVLPARKRSPSP